MSSIRRSPRVLSLALVLVVVGALGVSAFAPAVAGQVAPSRVEQLPTPAELLCPGQGEPFIRTELFFGSNKPGGGVVTEAEFTRFLDQVITPRFPDGLTLLTGLGQFRGSGGVTIKERSMLLILLYPRSTARASGVRIEEIRSKYETEFQQESVLRADDRLPVCVSF